MNEQDRYRRISTLDRPAREYHRTLQAYYDTKDDVVSWMWPGCNPATCLSVEWCYSGELSQSQYAEIAR